MDSDLVEKLLQTTGLSCDDLLTKLQQYRSGKNKTEHESPYSDSFLNKEVNPKVECAARENNSVIPETKSSPVLDDNCKVDKIHTQIDPQVSDGANNEKEVGNTVDENQSTQNAAKSPHKQDHEDIPAALKRFECGENLNYQQKEQNYVEDGHTDSATQNFETTFENLNEIENIADHRLTAKNDVEDITYFNCLRKNRGNKVKMSDYLENILNCGKSERDIDKKSTAGLEYSENNEQDETNDKRNTEKVTENLTAKASSQREKCVLKSNEIVTAQNSNDLEREFSAHLDCENNIAAVEELPSQKFRSVNDHNYSNFELRRTLLQQASNPSEVNQESSSSNNNNTPEDNLRNILKMQLSSLRNMKKSSGYLPDLRKPSMFFHNLKKKRKSCEINSGILSTADDGKRESNEDTIEKKMYEAKELSSNENSLVSISDETDIVILNVSGGVDKLTPDCSAPGKEARMFSAVTDNINKSVGLLNDENHPNYNTCVPDDNLPREHFLKTYKKRTYSSHLESNRISAKEKLPNLSVKKNISENFKKDPGVNKSVKNSEKSPFVSDSLEDFLSESAQLKISYTIPKLGAEEGISERTKKSPFDDIVNKTEPAKIEQDVIQKEPKLVKAKTLAEMRRHFEKMKAAEKRDSDAPDTPTPGSRYKRKKELTKNSLKVKGNEKKKNEEKDASRDMYSNTYDTAPSRNSIIMFDNKKLRVSSKATNKCIGIFHSKVTKEGSHEKEPPVEVGPVSYKKPSLLSSLTQNKSNRVTYKPGPLCRKTDLQNIESKDQWTTEVKTLPKIYLEVVPEVHKPINPAVVHLLPVFNEVVMTEDRVNFALSVFKPKNQTESNLEAKSFSFHVTYKNNQEKMVVRKPYTPVTYQGPSEYKASDPISDITSVLNDIITYVETKEIEDTLIKDDDIVEPDAKIAENTAKPRKHKIKRKKLDLELLRLSCKVIDVATNETQDTSCSKLYCKLGCVCKSLLCESVFSNHCQLVECMFGCKCSSVTSSATAASNNSLSVHTVNHLEDKAKKNMAKMEREFTQTLIHTDNDAILVGTAKMRRSAKPPKKYSDYVAEDVPFDNPEPLVFRNTSKYKACSVSLQKLDLDEITPLCLVHNLYNCHCKGESDFSPKKTNEIEQIPKIRIVKTKEDQHKAWFDSCARIRKVFPEYKERNKNPLYNEKLFWKNLGVRHLIKQKKQAIEDDNSNMVRHVSNNNSETVKKPNKRKQSFNVREDVLCRYSPSNKNEKEFALQRRKKKTQTNIVSKDVSVYNPVFDGEIKVSLNAEILKAIGSQHESLEYLRLLPWSKLIELFMSRKINIWTKETGSPLLLCNTVGHFPPPNFVDIRKVKKRTEIIDWILTDNLPPDRPRDLMLLILAPKEFNFLIAGCCVKKICDNDQAAVAPHELQEHLNKTPTTDPSLVSVGLKYAGLSEYSEEIRADDANRDENHEISMQKTKKETSTDFILRPKTILSDAKVFMNKVLKTTKGESPVTTSSRKKHVVSRFESLPMEQRLKIVGPEMWVSKDVVNEDSQLTSPEDVTSKIKQNSSILKTERRYVKLKSVLNTVPLVPKINTPLTETLNAQTTTDADRLKAFLCKQNSGENSRESIEKSMRFSSVSSDQHSEESFDNDVTQLENYAHEELTEVKESSKKKPRDPLEITVGDSSKLLTSKTLLRESMHSELSDNHSSKQIARLSQQNNKRKQQDPLEITVDELTSSQRQITESLETSSKQRHIMKRFRENPPTPSIDKTCATTTTPQCLIPSRSLKCTHKDMCNQNKTLILTNKMFLKRKLFCNKDGQGVEIFAPLPQVQKNLRWRMIYLNSDFTFMTFTRANYSIKYTDLMDVVKMSSNIRSTITLRNKEFCDLYKHPQFGIFCVPEHQDRLFVGPFLVTENHNMETLRYLQGKLIDTQIFNKMVGKKGNEKEPVWVYESSSRPVNLPKDLVIDITEEDEVSEITVVDLDSDSSEETQQSQAKRINSLMCPPFVEELTSDELKSTHINRYIITNIPHLGYFGACQRDSRAIEVFWPNGTRGYRFPNVTFAKNLLTQYLSQVFCPIPQNFKINVIIMTNIDRENNKPIDPKYFAQRGLYFCGEFGIYEKHTVSDDLLKKNKISSIDSVIKWHEEAQENEEAMIRIFGLFLMSNEELRERPDPEKILEWAISEIYILKKLSQNYESEKTDLQNMIRINSQKIKEKRKKQRSEETANKNFGDVSETIEIEDSDEDNRTSKAENSNLVFQKIYTSGKVKTPSFYSRAKDRSLLKSTWRSLLKDKEGQHRIEKSPVKSVKISLNNSNIILNKDKMLVTKLK